MSAGIVWFLCSLPDVLCKTPVQAGAPSAPTNFAAGVAAAVAATLLTQPADMLRTHMQVRAGPAPECYRVSHTHVQTGTSWFRAAECWRTRIQARACLSAASPHFACYGPQVLQVAATRVRQLGKPC